MNISLHLPQIYKGKIDTSFLRNYLVYVVSIFSLISWELSSLHRNALSASFTYFIHLLVGLLFYATHSFTSRVS